MSPIHDEDLVLHFYRDGLTDARYAEIERAIQEDDELRQRYERLGQDLEEAGAAFADGAPTAGFDDRIWRGFEQRLSARPRPRVRVPHRRRRSTWLKAASLVAAGLVLGLFIGRTTQLPSKTEPLLDASSGTKALVAELVNHLDSTERTMLIATRYPLDPELITELADALLDSHRLYASAAERAGRPELAEFLRRLEPVLLRLANVDALDGHETIRESIIKDDLPFKIRVVAATARRDLKITTPSRL